MIQQIYLDYHATTPCDSRVLQAMIPYFGDTFGNPSSSIHESGRLAADAVEKARAKVARIINAQPREIVFTGGATESNNLAILGLARGNNTQRKRIITSSIEHKSVLEPLRELKREGFDLVVLRVDRQGTVDMDVAKEAITEGTLLVSIQAANNEIGTIQDIRAIARVAHKHGAAVHCDAAQAVGKIPIDVFDWDVDMLSISAHKLYGPKGVGALYIRGGVHAFPIKPLLLGGGQEHEFRPGTLNVPGIVGLGEACSLSEELMPIESRSVAALRDQLEASLMSEIEGLTRNGNVGNRLPGNSSLTFLDTDAEALIINTPNLALSTGSACTTGAMEPSHVLLAIGLNRQAAYSTIRIGIGRFTTDTDIRVAAASILGAHDRLREIQSHG